MVCSFSAPPLDTFFYLSILSKLHVINVEGEKVLSFRISFVRYTVGNRFFPHAAFYRSHARNSGKFFPIFTTNEGRIVGN